MTKYKKLKFENDVKKKPTLFISREDILKLNSMLDEETSGLFLWIGDKQ